MADTERRPPESEAGLRRPVNAAAKLTRLTVERGVLEKFIQSKAKRASHCQAFIIATALYFLFLWSAVSHVSIPTAYNVEMALVNDVLGGDGGSFDPQDQGLWFAWLRQSLLPTLLPQADYNGNFTPLQAGRIDEYNLLLGGLRVIQWRTPPQSPCDGLPAELQAVYGEACYAGWGGEASSPDLTPAWNTSSAAGVEGAFVPVEQATGEAASAHVFEWTFEASKTGAQLAAEAGALQSAGWLDAGSAAVAAEAAVLNGQTGSIAFVRAVSSFTRGGRVSNAYEVCSVLLDPYQVFTAGAHPATTTWMLASEVLLVGYWIYLIYSTCRRGRRTVRGEGCSGLVTYWYVLDVGVIASLFAAGWTWAVTQAALSEVRAALGGASAASVAASASIHYQVSSATDAFFHFKTALVWCTALLTLRFFKYCRFNARLSVLTETVGRSCSDFAHFSVLWVLLQVGFGMWGYIHFGSQVADWSSLSRSVVTVWHYAMYVDDLSAQSLVAPVSAGTFYISFNLLITNLTLWCGLGLVLDNFGSIQSESHERGPTMCAEAVGFYKTARYHRCGMPRCVRARTCCASAWFVLSRALCWPCCACKRSGVRNGASTRAGSYASDDSTDYFDADGLASEAGKSLLRGGRLPLPVLNAHRGGAPASPARGPAGSSSTSTRSLRELLQDAQHEPFDGVTWADILAALGPSGPLWHTRHVTAQSLVDVLDMSPAHAARTVVEASAFKAESNRRAAAAAARTAGTPGAPPPPIKRGIFGLGGGAARAAAAAAAATAAATATAAAAASARRGSLPSTVPGALPGAKAEDEALDDDDDSSGHWSGADEVFYTMSPEAMAARIAALEWALARSASQLMSRSASGLYGAQSSVSASAFPAFPTDPAPAASLSGGLSGVGFAAGAAAAANAELLAALAQSVKELSKQVTVLQAKLDATGSERASAEAAPDAPAPADAAPAVA